MASNRRVLNEAALQATIKHLDFMMPSQVRQVVERYIYEQWRTEIAKNPHVKALAALKVGGPSIPWDRTADLRQGRYSYLQSHDRYRAQALLDDPDARWVVYRDGRNDFWRVRRVR
jgi:hypothetical protein